MDAIENDELEELIQMHVKLDDHKKNDVSSKINKKKEVEHDSKTIEKSICQEESQSCESDNDECEEEDCDHCSDDDDCSNCLSDFDEWAKWNEER